LTDNSDIGSSAPSDMDGDPEEDNETAKGVEGTKAVRATPARFNDGSTSVPNIHIAPHYDLNIRDWTTLWNIMVLAGEVKHRYLSPSLALSDSLPTWMQLGFSKPKFSRRIRRVWRCSFS